MNDTIDGIFEPFDSYVKDQLELRKTIPSDERARKGGIKDVYHRDGNEAEQNRAQDEEDSYYILTKYKTNFTFR